MFKFDDLSLSGFLSKPRLVYRVVEQYGVSKRMVEFHLQDAAKSGQFVIGERPVFQTLRLSNDRIKRFGGFVNVFGKSPVLVNRMMKLSNKEPSGSTKSKVEALSPFRFLSNADALKAKRGVRGEIAKFS